MDLYIFLYGQSIVGKAFTVEGAENDIVHPSQLICHFEGRLNVRIPA